jgi:hypothetical protein
VEILIPYLIQVDREISLLLLLLLISIGVIELMRNGKISMNHADFKDLRYESYLQKISRADVNSTQNTDIVHHFKLQSAYETTSSPIMPYTNYTYVDFFI